MPPSLLQPGQVLNERYRLERLLGKGGMGQVFLSEDLEKGDSVALKTLLHEVEEVDRRRFEREIRTLRNLQHPHIVPFRDLGQVDEVLFYTMDYLAGVTLEDVLRASGPINQSDALDWFLRLTIQVTEALAYLHERRLVHRDLKPSNILLTATVDPLPAAEEWWSIPQVSATLTDFGLVKTQEEDGTRAALGTPHYMSPEQLEASPAVDERSDLYALGVILYRACVGALPFQKLADILSRDPAPRLTDANPEFPRELDDLVAQLLEHDSFRRPANATEVAATLRAIFDRKRRRPDAPSVAKVSQPAFCGRQREVELLKERALHAARGVGHWVAISGERGTGKSWLVRRSEFRSATQLKQRVPVFSGSFTHNSSGFQSLLSALLRNLQRSHGIEHVVANVGPWGAHLGTVFPRLATEPWYEQCPPVDKELPEELLKERVFQTVIDILTRDVELNPRVLVLEDIHHANDFDVELLRRLLIQSNELPLLVVTTHRPEFQGRMVALTRLLAEARSEEKITELELSPFGLEEARAMVSSLLVPTRDIPTPFVEALLERSGGVPLYLLHLLNSLWSRDLVQLQGERWYVDPEVLKELPVPESMRSHFLLVLEDLPAQERRLLNIAATIGTEFSFDLLHEALDIDEFELDALCRNLTHAGILEEYQDGFRFLHAFEQEIVLAGLSQPMRRRLHTRVGQLLERHYAHDLDAHVGEIAEHLFEGGNPQASAYLRRAAAEARRRYAIASALRFNSNALQCTTESRERRELLVELGELHLALGETDDAERCYQEAVGLYAEEERSLDRGGELLTRPELQADVQSYAHLQQLVGELLGRRGDDNEALRAFEKAERISRRIGDKQGIATALVRRAGALLRLEDLDGAQSAYHSAVQLRESLESSEALRSALLGLGLIERLRGNLDEATAYTTEALQLAEQAEDLVFQARLLNQFGNLKRLQGQLRECTQAFERSLAIREQLGDRHGRAVCLMNLGRIRGDLGEFRGSLEAIREAGDLFQVSGDKRGQLLTLGNLGRLYMYQGEFHLAREKFEEYSRGAHRDNSKRHMGDALHWLAQLDVEEHDLDTAERRLRESLELVKGLTQAERTIQIHLARVRGRRGEVDASLALCAEVIEWAEQRNQTEELSEALRVSAENLRISGRHDEAIDYAQRALELLDDLHLPFKEGLACRTLGKVYRDAGYYWADQSAKYFDRAMRKFEMLGARFALAVTQLEFGIFLTLVEEIEGAIELFEECRGCFESLGVEPELQRVQKELSELQ